jgi:2-haloacid dehalogenase
VPPTPTIDNVVFDMGGVLLDWDPRHLYRKVFDHDEDVERFLDELSIIEWHVDNHDSGRRPMADSVADKAAQHPEYADALSVWVDRYPEMIGAPLPGMIDLLAELRGRVGLYLLSNAPIEPIDRIRANWPFLDWFDGFVISGEEKLVKPDPRIFLQLMERYDLDPAATVFVDDVARNVAGAAAVGLHAIQFESAEQLRRELVALGLVM